MASPSRTNILYVAIVAIFLSHQAIAQQPKEAPPAPVPTQIMAAKKVFISNGGGEIYSVQTMFRGGSDRAYNQFYAAIKSWGRYEIVPAPADADVVFEISFLLGNSVFNNKPSLDPHLRLVILDSKTHVVLWTFAERVEWALRIGHRDENFDQAMIKLVDDIKRLEGQPRADGSAQE